MEYVEKEKLIDEFYRKYEGDSETRREYAHFDHDDLHCVENVLTVIENVVGAMPADDVAPVIHGYNKLSKYPTLFQCSVCGWECDDTTCGTTIDYNYCPGCGAVMDGQAQ